VRQIVHEELKRLPEKYRQPLILCCLEGRTQEEAARQLGWTAGTLRGMLTRGRDILRQRLTKRGLSLTAPLFVGVLAPGTTGAVLAKTTAHAAVLLVSGQKVGVGISAQAIALAQGGMNAMWMTKLTIGAAVLTAVSVLAAGAGLATYQAKDGGQTVATQVEEPKAQPIARGKQAQAKEEKQPREDLYGDPMPAGAVVRMGTTRWRHGGGVCFAAMLPNGKRVLTAGFDKTIRLWEYPSGKEIRRIGDANVDDAVDWKAGQFFQPVQPTQVALSRDGKLEAESFDGNINV
jgi:hypothetical protein